MMGRTGTSCGVRPVYQPTRSLLGTRIGRRELPSDLAQRSAVERELWW